MNKLGNEAFEVVTNASHLQSAWAKEHNLKTSGDALVLEQLKFISPDILFLQDCLRYTPGYIDAIRETVPSIKQIIGWSCSPFTSLQVELFSKFDYIFGCSQKFTNYFNKLGIKCYEMNHAFEPSILDQIRYTPFDQRIDLVFVGSLIGGNEFHSARIRLLDKLSKSSQEIKYYLTRQNSNVLYRTALQSTYLIGKILSGLGLRKTISRLPILKKSILLVEFPRSNKLPISIKSRIAGESLYGIEMFNEISKSRIGFNSHGGVAEDYAANARMFEVTGVGSCLLTDDKLNITKFFTPDTEVVTYKSVEECTEKFGWLIKNYSKAKEIAEAGQKRTLKDHNFKNRTEQLHQVILENFK
jgi:hypothetical protein